MTGRLTVGLYNSLDRTRFAEAHRRALARAAPVAAAFDCNLAVFGFPFDPDLRTPRDISEWLVTTTSIGQGGDWIVKLAEEGRFSNFPLPKGGFPPQLGRVVIATRRPDSKISISPREVALMLKDGRSALLVLGLGPRGLPGEVMSMGEHHMDLTGRGVSLETCTAIGAAVARIMTHLEALHHRV
ncbi:MAG: DUF531 family protein [Candidatus Thermoplasmatota archaeon]|nr:DUF531 family protein [Candidatus Thermoplasmatota archaeon]